MYSKEGVLCLSIMELAYKYYIQSLYSNGGCFHRRNYKMTFNVIVQKAMGAELVKLGSPILQSYLVSEYTFVLHYKLWGNVQR